MVARAAIPAAPEANASMALREKRRCPPSVLRLGTRPASLQRRNVGADTWSRRLASAMLIQSSPGWSVVVSCMARVKSKGFRPENRSNLCKYDDKIFQICQGVAPYG
jgi:hypothetical protein